MGIQGLARRLEPYSCRYTAKELEGYAAIIDGPSLAYEAHKLALSAAASQTKIPSYSEINLEAIKWLDTLENQGITVAAVLFDGALPDAKRAERLSRTEQNNRRVQQLRASYATTACPIPTYLGSTSYAFLAPSLREALTESPFASRTRIVPGEADDSCALRARDLPRSIIFTSDTDLLLFDYHPETLVVLFQDAESPVGLKAFSPDHIAKKLQLKTLVPLAHAIQQHLSEGMDDLVRDARDLDTDSSAYLDFHRRYTAAIVAPIYLQQYVSLNSTSQSLDVRIFEFVHEALNRSQNLPVYLPLLAEDPNQASAWNIAQDIRTLAYSLLASSTSTIREYKRKAQGISPQDIRPYSDTDLHAPAKEIDGRVGGLLKWAKSKDLNPSLLWSLFALSLVLGELNTAPSLPLVSRVINADFDYTWPFVQLTARFQAAMYSLRMLKQMTEIWLAVNQHIQSKLRGTLSSLQSQMANLPAIADMFFVPGQSKRLLADHEQLKALIEEIYVSIGVEVATEQVSNKKKKRQAREAERKKRKTEQRQQSSR
ncbi:hypothetical protein HBH56_047910 [Parastagonospora nodorum]|uniref:Asteroid domain-containing protein n=2 Tax=Phaeosphaeria nodorum (strain SN15 / ATCC MYA-4574 / FGSC 10173) TaxID=321614 RepID=A0A7U2EWU5_PHANO|nr:hypothetical protein HBH56_047910 [Parastagonospora nodorum]QRC92495.1 hypothetical protein JI435_084360 [Parastagonospora nodorum SN15]KAH3933235.1 hypothetical protein HBH54_075650 [Parastagonospora nodorum]KAH3973024.1 hypothetical protein HBH52_147700 [Parastagonospora nodorum]KAH4124521.1 hypothetical protein HBH45_238390 [Parastagonospora nodorum]